MGGLLAVLAKWRVLKVRRMMDHPECGRCDDCVNSCKMGAFQAESVSSLDEECIDCLTCYDTCKHDVLSISFAKPSIRERESVLPSRRAFLTATALGLTSALLLRGSLSAKTSSLPRLRPPGADRDEIDFLAKCTRCGECMKVCPTNGLQPLLFQGGLYEMWSPVLIPRIGYCKYECNLCSEVCSTGAIARLALEDKKKWQIGVARVDRTRCRNCLRCEQFCPVPDKAIKRGLRHPMVVEQLCIGCGICENVCLVNPSAIRVVSLR